MSSKSIIQPLDRLVILLIFIFSIVIGILLWIGDPSTPKVRSFSWQDQEIGAQDTAFILTFNRPMDQKSVEQNLNIDPPLPGKISWAGRRMAYTLQSPAPYGTKYTLKLQGAIDKFSQSRKLTSTKPIEPFIANFFSRDRAFLYIGVEKEERGRLIMYNLTKTQKTVLTPSDLVVVDFKPYPDGDRILFGAIDRNIENPSFTEQKLFTVTTGINFNNANDNQKNPAGKIDPVLDATTYQNLKFDLSPDGKTIIVQRLNRNNPADFGLWILKEGQTAEPLKTEPVGDFIIAPDSSALAVTQGQGIGILPLEMNQSNEVKPLDFLPKFGLMLNFNPEGNQAALVKFNNDYTRSLFVVNNLGEEKEIWKTSGSIFQCKFTPKSPLIYCLVSQLLPGTEYQEQPYLMVIDQTNGKVKPLVLLPPKQIDVEMSLSGDGLALLFDQIITEQNSPINDSIKSEQGEIIAQSKLWLLPVLPSIINATQPVQPQDLTLSGYRARWLP